MAYLERVNYAVPKVLVIDDEASHRMIMSGLLNEWDIDVNTARSGREALERIQHEPPDLIVLDVRLPDVSGYELCSRLRTNPATRRIPIMLVSVLSNEDDCIRGLESGADDYICKPVSEHEFFARIKAVLRSYH